MPEPRVSQKKIIFACYGGDRSGQLSRIFAHHVRTNDLERHVSVYPRGVKLSEMEAFLKASTADAIFLSFYEAGPMPAGRDAAELKKRFPDKFFLLRDWAFPHSRSVVDEYLRHHPSTPREKVEGHMQMTFFLQCALKFLQARGIVPEPREGETHGRTG